MEKQHNPNEPGKSGNPGRESGGQHGGSHQEREIEQREREQREREKQGGGSGRSGER